MKNNASRDDKIFDIILEEAFDEYAAELANEESKYQMTEDEILKMESNEKTIYNKLIKDINSDNKIHISFKKICIMVAIFMFAIIVVSFGASAVYTWIQRTNMSMSGTDLNIYTKTLIFEDYNNIKRFKNKSEIIIPNWLPEGMEINNMTDEEETLVIFYKSEVDWVTINVSSSFDSSVKIDTENNLFNTRTGKILDMECKIVEMTSEAGLTVYSAYWNSNNSSYTLMTNVSEEEFNKILENLIFFKE